MLASWREGIQALNVMWPHAVGYTFAVLVGYFLINWVMNQMWRGMGWVENQHLMRPAPWLPRMVGCVERGLYVASFQVGNPEFIAVWLTLKVAGQWNRWAEDKEYGGTFVAGRAFYNTFMIGSGLSIAYAVTGAKLIDWCTQGEWLFVISVPAALFLATGLLWGWARRHAIVHKTQT